MDHDNSLRGVPLVKSLNQGTPAFIAETLSHPFQAKHIIFQELEDLISTIPGHPVPDRELSEVSFSRNCLGTAREITDMFHTNLSMMLNQFLGYSFLHDLGQPKRFRRRKIHL
jgi:hypothetical protein